jgi:hypothetical protein
VIAASVIAVAVAVKSPVACSAAKPTAVISKVPKDASTIVIASAPTAAACEFA